MILDDRPDLHVLLLRRREGSAFVGGMDVFPGGGVDPHDAAAGVEAICDGLGDAAASERLGLASGGLAYWVAAARETFEEAGVLFARGAGVDAALAERLAAARRRSMRASCGSMRSCATRAAARARRAALHRALDHAAGSAAPLRHPLLRDRAAGRPDARWPIGARPCTRSGCGPPTRSPTSRRAGARCCRRPSACCGSSPAIRAARR